MRASGAARLAIVAGLIPFSTRLARADEPATRVSFVCATQRSIPADVRTMLKPLMAEYGERGVASYGDRAAVLRFGDPPTDIFMVPLSCGATGNCTWGLLAAAPVRKLAVVSGAVIQVGRGRGWPSLEAFTHTGAGEGDLETLVFRDQRYRRESIGKLTPEAADKRMACVDNEACCPRPQTYVALSCPLEMKEFAKRAYFAATVRYLVTTNSEGHPTSVQEDPEKNAPEVFRPVFEPVERCIKRWTLGLNENYVIELGWGATATPTWRACPASGECFRLAVTPEER